MGHITNKNSKLLRGLLRVAPSKIHGRGVFAKIDISKGTYMGEYEGPKATDAEIDNSPNTFEVEHHGGTGSGLPRSFVEIREGKTILRFLNHQGRWPNGEFDGFKLYALKNIKAGDEITFNYERTLAEIKAWKPNK
jgi:SET domain-containing protein